MNIEPYLHHLVLPDGQFDAFDIVGNTAMDARAAHTHKHAVFVGDPLWIWDEQSKECGM